MSALIRMGLRIEELEPPRWMSRKEYFLEWVTWGAGPWSMSSVKGKQS